LVVFEGSFEWLDRRIGGHCGELWLQSADDGASCRVVEPRRLLSPKARMAQFNVYLGEAYYSGVLMSEE